PVHTRQILLAVRDDPPCAGVRLTHGRLHALVAVFGGWVRRQPVRHPLVVARSLHAPERRQHLRNAGRIPSGARRVFHAQTVGLRLVVAPVFEEEHAEAAFAELRERPCLRHEDGAENQAELGARRSRVLLRRVTRGDVSDLVPDRDGEPERSADLQSLRHFFSSGSAISQAPPVLPSPPARPGPPDDLTHLAYSTYLTYATDPA